ncbi:MAG TPA: PIG-L family deacetylase [Desulfomonilia bacterium]
MDFKKVPSMESLLDKSKKHLFMFSHHDDEIVSAGIIQRLQPGAALMWLTNSDGLYFKENVTPEEYGKKRVAEGWNVAHELGFKDDDVTNGLYSEVDNYRLFVNSIKSEAQFEEGISFWRKQGRDIYAKIKKHDPDIIWTYAFQGGMPEHDLTHVLTAACIDSYEREFGKKIQMVEIPAYELTVLISFRFNPWYKGTKYFIDMTRDELLKKLAAAFHYPSQVELIEKFRKVIDNLGKVSGLIGRPFDFESYCGREYFAPVCEPRDYSRPPYRIDFFNYMFDDYLGEPVKFIGMMDRIFHELSKPVFHLEQGKTVDNEAASVHSKGCSCCG